MVPSPLWDLIWFSLLFSYLSPLVVVTRSLAEFPMFRLTGLLALVSAVSLVVASYSNHTIFQDTATGITLRYVSNSGICETTPGVKQYSGYADFGNGNVRDPLPCIAAVADTFSVPLLVVLRGPQKSYDGADGTLA